MRSQPKSIFLALRFGFVVAYLSWLVYETFMSSTSSSSSSTEARTTARTTPDPPSPPSQRPPSPDHWWPSPYSSRILEFSSQSRLPFRLLF